MVVCRAGRVVRVGMVLLCAVAARALAAPPLVTDPLGDVSVRRTDGVAATAELPAGHNMPDLISHRHGTWLPDDAFVDVFVGNWSTNGVPTNGFLRIDLVFDGLINPPGPLGTPHLFGPHPLFGFFEIDMDNRVDTGGELGLTAFRYLGAAARYGGVVTQPRFSGRQALDDCPGSFDGNISTGPYFPERSGEEFHWFLAHSNLTFYDFGTDGDITFESGETWLGEGPFLERAQGYEGVSLAIPNGRYIGGDSRVRFSHSLIDDRTEVSLVYPLTNAGSAAMRGEVRQPLDGDAANQNSILEGLDDLVFSANFAGANDPGNPLLPLIADWAGTNAVDHLNPDDWRVNSIFLGVFVATDGVTDVFAFSDLAPDVVTGDFNGDTAVDAVDLALFDQFMATADGGACDEDATTNGEVDLINFGANFNVYDTNYDGFVNGLDAPDVAGVADFDGDNDGDVDLADYAIFQICGGSNGDQMPLAICDEFDEDRDGDVDEADVVGFQVRVIGPRDFLKVL